MFSNLKLLKRKKKMTNSPSVLDDVKLDFVETPIDHNHKITPPRTKVLPLIGRPFAQYGRYMVEVVLS